MQPSRQPPPPARALTGEFTAPPDASKPRARPLHAGKAGGNDRRGLRGERGERPPRAQRRQGGRVKAKTPGTSRDARTRAPRAARASAAAARACVRPPTTTSNLLRAYYARGLAVSRGRAPRRQFVDPVKNFGGREHPLSPSPGPLLPPPARARSCASARHRGPIMTGTLTCDRAGGAGGKGGQGSAQDVAGGARVHQRGAVRARRLARSIGAPNASFASAPRAARARVRMPTAMRNLLRERRARGLAVLPARAGAQPKK